MKRKTFEIGDDLVAAFEGFCADRRLVEKQVVESLIAHFIQQDPEAREKILMTRFVSTQTTPTLRVAAKPAKGVKGTPDRRPKA